MDLIIDNLNNIDHDGDIENSRNNDTNDYIETYKPSFFDNAHSEIFESNNYCESDEYVCIVCTCFIIVISVGSILVINLF